VSHDPRYARDTTRLSKKRHSPLPTNAVRRHDFAVTALVDLAMACATVAVILLIAFCLVTP